MNPFAAITSSANANEPSLEGDSPFSNPLLTAGEGEGQSFVELLGKEQKPTAEPAAEASSPAPEAVAPTEGNANPAVGTQPTTPNIVPVVHPPASVDLPSEQLQQIPPNHPDSSPPAAATPSAPRIPESAEVTTPESPAEPQPAKTIEASVPPPPEGYPAITVEPKPTFSEKPVAEDQAVPPATPASDEQTQASPPRREIPTPEVAVVAASDWFSNQATGNLEPETPSEDPLAEPPAEVATEVDDAPAVPSIPLAAPASASSATSSEASTTIVASAPAPVPVTSTAQAPRSRPRESSRQDLPAIPAASFSPRSVRPEGLADPVGEITENGWKTTVFEPESDLQASGTPVAMQDTNMPAKASTANELPLPASFPKTGSEKVDLRLQGDAAKAVLDTDFSEAPDLDSDGGEFFSSGSNEFRESLKESSHLGRSAGTDVKFREAARETVLFHALQLKDLGRTHLDVTFQPDEDTLITLHLQTINGEIVVEGRLDQGGNQDLISDWARIQRSLARDGVQVRNLDFNQNGQRESADQRRDSESQQSHHHGHQPRNTVVTEAIAADAAPFPGVAATFDQQSTWQAWG